MRPIIFLDVDGVLNPWISNRNAKIQGFKRFRIPVDGWTYTVFLNPLHGEWIKSMNTEIVWATTWEHEANISIGPKIGLKNLPVVEFSKHLTRGTKTPTIIEYADGRPFVWLDDCITDEDLELLSHYNCLGYRIPHNIGLTKEDMDIIRMWLNENT